MNREEQIKKAHDLLSEGNFEEARSLVEAIKKHDAEELENKASEEQPEEDKIIEETKDEEKEEPKEQEPEKESEEQPKDEEKRSLEQEGEEENMEKVVLDGKEISQPETEVRGFLNYVRSHNPKMDLRALPEGVKSTDVGAIIPQDIVTKTKTLPETVVDLRNLVQTVKVSTPTGKYPILKSTEAVMHTVAELDANPDLDKPQFENVLYDVDTYRGQIPVSRESLDDSDEDLGALIARHIQRIALNTANSKIVANLKTATAKTVKNLDEIKTIINTEFDPAYNLQFVVSQSFYNEVDLMKDNEGRYLLQPSITAQSGKSLLGLNVTVLSDKLLAGSEAPNKKVAFLGDPAGFTSFFDRNEMAVRWQEHQHYGEILAAAMRFDVKKVDAAAGKFLTLDTTVVAGE
ncbi:major head protein [Enterococcus phage IME-EFm1]|uniref:Capsid protein n=1 Tax=Enterococcus phage IME-EFm1 TaxID=1445858 RepID=A0A060AI54_9CAUD|nr:major head protein [Enterococcus phage IME-EFm1]AIA65074.1 capsid protein [Enterococcus phage IME-EFm1]